MLNQVSHNDRILFLRLFTAELLLNSKKQEEEAAETKEEIKEQEEKIIDEELRKPIKEKPLLASILSRPSIKEKLDIEESKDLRHELTKPIAKPVPQTKRPAQIPSQRRFIPRFGHLIRPRQMPPMQRQIPAQIPSPNTIAPTNEDTNLNFGKLNILAKDQSVTVIECQGPDKFILIQRMGQFNLTKISLAEKEIEEIVNSFAAKARIPIVGGILKASVGDFTISAVISEFVGSRFIINRKSPYAMIDPNFSAQQGRQLPPQSTPFSS